MPGPGFAVIDLETTGLYAEGTDRIVEVAVVHVNDHGRITGSWETLVNPERDLGPQHIHGIRAAEVMQAPLFRDIAPELIDLLDQRVVVAHNSSFDTRFVNAELNRAGYAVRADYPCLCTMRLARDILPGGGRSLADCCSAFDIDLTGAHRASVDARATAELLGAYLASTDAAFWDAHIDRALQFTWPPMYPANTRAEWRARGASVVDPLGFLERITRKLPDTTGPVEHQEYLALLDRALIDRQISVHESDALVQLAEELRIDRDNCERLHREYFEGIAAIAWEDGILTVDEIGDLASVAKLLRIPDAAVHAALVPPAQVESVVQAAAGPAPVESFTLHPGDEIVLTGEMARPRDDWHRELNARGFVPKPAVTKKIKLVVAADPDSLSGKARKARDYGIPVIDEGGLARLLE